MVDSFAWGQPKVNRPGLMVQPGPCRGVAMLVVEAWQLTRHRPGRDTVVRRTLFIHAARSHQRSKARGQQVGG